MPTFSPFISLIFDVRRGSFFDADFHSPRRFSSSFTPLPLPVPPSMIFSAAFRAMAIRLLLRDMLLSAAG